MTTGGFIDQAVVCLHQHLKWPAKVIASVTLATDDEAEEIIERFEAGLLLTTEEHRARTKALAVLAKSGWTTDRIALAFEAAPRGLTGPRPNGREARRARGEAMDLLRVKGWAHEEIALVFCCSSGNVRHTLRRNAQRAEEEG